MTKKFLICLFLFPVLLFFSLKPLQAQFVNYNINTGKNYAIVPFKMYKDFIIIKVILGGKIPLNFILDTGAANTIVIHKEYADLVGANYERRLFIQGVDRSQVISALLTEGMDIELPEVTATGQHLLVLENNYIEFDKYAGTRIDGILGMDVFRRFIVKIDYESNLIYLFEPDLHSYNTSKYDSLTFVGEKGKMYYHSEITISNKKHKIKWLIDTGAAMTALLKCPESDSTFIPQYAVPGNIGKGLGGFIWGYLGNVESIKVGNHIFENINSNFQQIPDSLFNEKELVTTDGLLGNKILKQFHIIFDYNKNKIYLRPNRKFNVNIKSDLSGMGLVASGTYLNEFIIEDVYPNSPASNVGLKEGDFIKKINGKGTLLMDLEGIEKKFSNKKGKKIKLVVKRGEEKLKFIFYLDEYM